MEGWVGVQERRGTGSVPVDIAGTTDYLEDISEKRWGKAAEIHSNNQEILNIQIFKLQLHTLTKI